MMKFRLIVFTLMVGILSSCSQRLVDFTIISTKNIDLSTAVDFQRGKSRNAGEDKVHIILSFPIGNPDMEEAIDRALEQTPGAVALLDGVVYQKAWWALFYGQSSYLIEGTPLIDPKLADSSSPRTRNYQEVTFNRQGLVKSSKELSEEEYLSLKQEMFKGGSVKKYDFISTLVEGGGSD